MRLTLADLEEAELDPEGFIKRVQDQSGEKSQGGRYNRPQARRDIVLNWHQGKITEAEARAQFAKKCAEYKSDSSALIGELEMYFTNHRESSSKTKQVRRPVEIVLPQSIDRRFSVNTKIDRLDRNADGTYTAVLFASERQDWQQNFRLPIIQLAIAEKYNIPLEDVDVALYCFEDGDEQRFQFSRTEIDDVQAKMQKLLMLLSPLVKGEEMPPESSQYSFDF